MKLFNLYIDNKNKKDREWFQLGGTICCGMILISVFPLLFESGTHMYNQGNNGILISIIAIWGLFLISKLKTLEIYRKGFRLLKNDTKDFKLFDYGDVMLFFSFVISCISFVFVLDLSFINDFGIKIGGVVGINLVNLIKYVFSSRMK